MKPLIDTNTSGQGQCPTWPIGDFLGTTAQANGYAYSHSTPVTYPDGTKRLLHTFKRARHCVSYYDGANAGNTSCGTGTAHQHHFRGADELNRHLKSKAKRYPELHPDADPACSCGRWPAQWYNTDDTRREYLCRPCAHNSHLTH